MKVKVSVMNGYSNFIFAFIIVSIISGCRNNKVGNATPIEVNVNVEVDGNPSNFFEGYKYVELETTDSCLISDVTRYDIEKSVIAIQNNYEILFFNKDGKFISSFCNQGQGPEDYLNIDAMRLYNGQLYVLDMEGKTILVYTTSGDFLRKINLDDRYVNFHIVNDDAIVLASGNFNHTMYEFAWIDARTGEVKSRAGKYGESHTVTLNDYIPFSGKSGDDLIVNVPFILTSYKLGDSDITPATSFKFNSMEQLPELSLETVNTLDLMYSTMNKSLVRQLGYYLKTKTANYQSFRLFLMTNGGWGDHIAKYNDEGDEVEQIRLGHPLDEKFPYLIGKNFKFHEGQLVDIMPSRSLLYMDEHNGRDYWSKKGMTEDSNPVLFFYKFK